MSYTGLFKRIIPLYEHLARASFDQLVCSITPNFGGWGSDRSNMLGCDRANKKCHEKRQLMIENQNLRDRLRASEEEVRVLREGCRWILMFDIPHLVPPVEFDDTLLLNRRRNRRRADTCSSGSYKKATINTRRFVVNLWFLRLWANLQPKTNCEIGRLFTTGAVVSSDGNARSVGRDTVLATPTMTCKGGAEDMPGLTDMEGKPLGDKRASSELAMHC